MENFALFAVIVAGIPCVVAGVAIWMAIRAAEKTDKVARDLAGHLSGVPKHPMCRNTLCPPLVEVEVGIMKAGQSFEEAFAGNAASSIPDEIVEAERLRARAAGWTAEEG